MTKKAEFALDIASYVNKQNLPSLSNINFVASDQFEQKGLKIHFRLIYGKGGDGASDGVLTTMGSTRQSIAENEELKSKMQKLEVEKDELITTCNKIEEKLADSQDQVTNGLTKIAELEAAMVTQKEELEKVESEREAFEEQLSKEQDKYKELEKDRDYAEKKEDEANKRIEELQAKLSEITEKMQADAERLEKEKEEQLEEAKKEESMEKEEL